jgi:transcriptional regulator with XRE-family HTH domain
MVIENPSKAPGQSLREYRDLYGVTRKEVAGRLSKHRNTLLSWEKASEVNATTIELYRRAVDAIVREKLGAAS